MSNGGILTLIGLKDKHGHIITKDTPISALTEKQTQLIGDQVTMGMMYVLRVKAQREQGLTPDKHRDCFRKWAEVAGLEHKPIGIHPGFTTYRDLAAALGQVTEPALNDLLIAFDLHPIDNFRKTLDLSCLDTIGIDYVLLSKVPTGLWEAAQKGDKSRMLQHIADGDDIDSKDEKGFTPLHYACIEGKNAVLGILLDKGTAVAAQSKTGLFPLHLATQRGHDNAVRELIKGGAQVDAKRSDSGTTSLQMAAQMGYDEIARLLVDGGADVNASTAGGETPLHLAAYAGHTALAGFFVQNGAKVDAHMTGGETPILLAAQEGHEAIVALLAENGADIHAKGENGLTPLHYAAQNGHETIVTMLLARDAHANAYDDRNVTPLRLAAEKGQAKTAELLLAAGADVNSANERGYRALHVSAQHGHEALVELLLKNGANVNQTNERGTTPLHSAALGGETRTTQILIDAGADMNADNSDGETPMDLALKGNHTAVVELLSSRGGEAHAQRKGSSSCFVASAVWSIDSWQVASLRAFRDRDLVRTTAGRRFTKWYYRAGPGIADRVRRSEVLRRIACCLIYPIVWLSLFRTRSISAQYASGLQDDKGNK